MTTIGVIGVLIGMSIMGKILDTLIFGGIFNEMSNGISHEMREWSLGVIKETGCAGLLALLSVVVTVLAIVAISCIKWGYMF